MRAVWRWLLGAFYLVAGALHLVVPQPFLSIMPVWVPQPELVVCLTGVAEILGALALVQGISLELRRAGAIGLAAYAVCVFPANIHHFALDLARSEGGFGLVYHLPRMATQPVIVWLALWAGEVIHWPFPRRTDKV